LIKNNLAIPYPRRREGKRGGFYLFIFLFYLDLPKNKKEGRKQSRPPAFPQKTRKIPLLFWGREYEKQLINIKIEKK
jgi:hypothetical protein